ncbi:hypothetical protein SLEP1_g50806 [Rubroshorea leprosula]|uniref:Uncharacterized protein n=1 Tax=Rubroshorea leprosula TaxID=152421 RepID=A0AAV5M199_9ROSI|nr:hypothetical protein SLEP1_g50806 [Rubroshorea leprosula]
MKKNNPLGFIYLFWWRGGGFGCNLIAYLKYRGKVNGGHSL